MTTVTRPPAWGGIALVGDAATAADPLQGVGLGWAIESAEMLAHSACEYLGDCASLRAALRRYARRHTIRFGAHQAMSNYVARALPYLPLERGVLRAAANDPQIALEVYRFSSRDIQPYRLLRPGTLARIARVNVGLSRDPAARRPDPHAYVPGVRTPATARASEPELAHA
jgi:2-polyprenyl-6-methoxyphenol hydroxylase-like FAD-dependent oxidoreductase